MLFLFPFFPFPFPPSFWGVIHGGLNGFIDLAMVLLVQYRIAIDFLITVSNGISLFPPVL